MMDKTVLVSALAVFLSFAWGCVSSPNLPPQTNVSYKIDEMVSATELKNMTREKPGSYVLLDARSDEYFDGDLIPTAKRMSYDCADGAITSVLPDKSAAVITYCSNVRCPASKKLADRLRRMGYTNVKEYPDGIQGWRDSGNSVEKQSAR